MTALAAAGTSRSWRRAAQMTVFEGGLLTPLLTSQPSGPLPYLVMAPRGAEYGIRHRPILPPGREALTVPCNASGLTSVTARLYASVTTK